MSIGNGTTKKSLVVGDAAKLREAVVLALSLLDLKEGVPYKTVSQKDIDFMKAALAKPPRQCDVGTPYEQSNRMRQFCAKQKRNGIINCGYCPIKHQYQRDCTLAWAQMPYAEEGEGDE